LDGQKTFAGITLGGEKDPKEYTLLYEMKIIFLVSKLYKLKTQFWSQKYQDINNKLRDYMNWESTPVNLKAGYIKADPKHNPERNLHPQVSKAEERREKKKIWKQKRREILESKMPKLFEHPVKYIYKDIRNQYNDNIDRKQFEKRKKTMFLDLKSIKYYTPNQRYLNWKEMMVVFQRVLQGSIRTQGLKLL
jgi:hypothetical protein